MSEWVMDTFQRLTLEAPLPFPILSVVFVEKIRTAELQLCWWWFLKTVKNWHHWELPASECRSAFRIPKFASIESFTYLVWHPFFFFNFVHIWSMGNILIVFFFVTERRCLFLDLQYLSLTNTLTPTLKCLPHEDFTFICCQS